MEGVCAPDSFEAGEHLGLTSTAPSIAPGVEPRDTLPLRQLNRRNRRRAYGTYDAEFRPCAIAAPGPSGAGEAGLAHVTHTFGARARTNSHR